MSVELTKRVHIVNLGAGGLIVASNFLFNSSYTIMFLHPFFYLHSEGLAAPIVVGMALFGSLQVGGFLFLELITRKFSTSLEAMLFLRATATVLLVIPNSGCILLGFAMMGLSHSMFFVNSRMLLGRTKSFANAFFKLSLSTNLAYLLMPGVGAFIIWYWSSPFVGMLLSLVFTTLSYRALILAHRQSAKSSTPSDEIETERFLPIKVLLVDCVRFAFFVLPYTAMMALVNVKTYTAGYGAAYSSALFSANSLIVIAVLLVCISMDRDGWKRRMGNYTVMSLCSSALCAFALFSGYTAFALIFVFWSICEAYQGPTIEEHIFSSMEYPKGQLKWIVGVDGVCSFIGPILAGSVFFRQFL